MMRIRKRWLLFILPLLALGVVQHIFTIFTGYLFVVAAILVGLPGFIFNTYMAERKNSGK